MRQNCRLLIISLISLASLESGCSSEKYGEEISNEARIVKISEVVGRTDQAGADGKIVVLRGKIISECPVGCWFYLEDETGRIKVDLLPSNFAIPQKVGATITVKGKIKKGDSGLYLIGTGVVL